MEHKNRYTRQTVDAYERVTGFIGIGNFFQDRGLIVIVEDSECVATK